MLRSRLPALEPALGDIVAAMVEDGSLWFTHVQVGSKNSLLRAVLFDEGHVDEVRRELVALGCSTEWDQPHKLVGVSVPDSASLSAVQEYLQGTSERGWLDYEEPILRQ